MAFLALSPADVFSSSYVGEAEAVIRRAFATARSAAPCVLFFDELDAILSGRGSHAEARVLSTFLNEMDGVDVQQGDGVLVLGATNRPRALDAALLRPGRFDKVIYVPPPDIDGRRAILEWQSRSLCGSDWDLDRLACEETCNMTGAEIVGACREAAIRSFRDANIGEPALSQDCLLQSLREVKPLLSNLAILEEYQSFALGR